MGTVLLLKLCFSVPTLDSGFVLVSQGLYREQDLCQEREVVVPQVLALCELSKPSKLPQWC